MSIHREDLLAAQSGDKAEMERLLTENSALIWSVAHRFTGRLVYITSGTLSTFLVNY